MSDIYNKLRTPREVFMGEGIMFYPQILKPEEIARLRDACEHATVQYRAELQQQMPDKAREAKDMRQLHDARWHRETKEHLNVLLETIADPRILGPAEQVLEGPSLFRATSLFFNPHEGNTDGHWHRDEQFVMHTEDEVRQHFEAFNKSRNNNLSGVQMQIALVDTEDIEYVPYSAARYDSPEEHYIRCADERAHNRESGMPNALRVQQKAGDAILFNPSGVHRGRYHADKLRRTLLLTYTALDNLLHDHFSNQPWMLEPGYLSGLSPRARAYMEQYIAAYRHTWTK